MVTVLHIETEDGIIRLALIESTTDEVARETAQTLATDADEVVYLEIDGEKVAVYHPRPRRSDE